MKERRVVDTWAIALNEDNAKIIQIDNEDGWGEVLTMIKCEENFWQYYRAGHQVHTMGGWEVRFTTLINLYSKLIITILLMIVTQWSHRMATCEGPAEKDIVLQYMMYLATYKAYKDPPEVWEEGKMFFFSFQ